MNNSTASPTRFQERIQELDLFRGFAILGIFMVNILVMNVSFAYRMEWEMEQTGWIQQASFFTLETFFYSKFFAIFSFLFGIGVALQMTRSRQNGTYSTSFFLRRFISLFLFGVLHIIFLWAGDILHLYGMLGIVLLLFFKASARVLLWSAIIVFLFPFYSILLEQLLEWLAYDYRAPLAELTRQDILELKHNGSYLSGIILRLKEYSFAMGLIYSGIAPVALSMMLLGGYVVKKGILDQLDNWIPRIKPYLFVSLIFLLIYRFILLYLILPSFEIQHGSPLSITLMTIFQLSDIAISLSYLWVLAYVWKKCLLKQILSPLQYVGRAALSNYILQSVIAYLIMRTFNGYEYFSAFGCIMLVVSIYIFQIFLSKIWLTYYRFGPLEWCWRCISYMKLLLIKR